MSEFTKKDLLGSKAIVSHLPCGSGDGYGYGVCNVLTIGDASFLFGERNDSLCVEVARRWNDEADLVQALSMALAAYDFLGGAPQDFFRMVPIGATVMSLKDARAVLARHDALAKANGND
jgi:hypothetical protein